MKSMELEKIDKDLEQLHSLTTSAKANIATAQSADDIKTEICTVWSKVRPYVIWAENIPAIGKFITLLAEVLDSICGTGQ